MIRKTCIGIITSHDDGKKNNKLVALLEYFSDLDVDILKKYILVFTGGTYDRVISGYYQSNFANPARPINKRAYERLTKHCQLVRLPSGREGGVTYLSDLIVKRCVSILWFYLSPKTHHWLIPENLAQMRLCDQWSVKRLMTWGSIIEWIDQHAEKDTNFNPINLRRSPLKKYYNIYVCDNLKKETDTYRKTFELNKTSQGIANWELIPLDIPNYLHDFIIRKKYLPFKDKTIALISHDAMKSKMTEFTIYYEKELNIFVSILATSSTGKEIQDSLPTLQKIRRFHSGPKGGDIEISAEILRGKCHIVVFFIDPLNPHPHIDDIRNVFAACMIRDDVIMLTNDVHAREWFEKRLKNR